MGFRQWQSQNTAGEPKVPSLVLRWQRQWNQRAVTLRPPPVLKPPDSRDTLFPEPLTPTYPTPLWIEFPWCSEGLTSLRGRVSGFQGLRGIAHCKREEINGAPTLDPQLQNSGVPLKLLLGCHVQNQRLQTSSLGSRPSLWMSFFGLKVLSQHFMFCFIKFFFFFLMWTIF